jgi:hypothetical protein
MMAGVKVSNLIFPFFSVVVGVAVSVLVLAIIALEPQRPALGKGGLAASACDRSLEVRGSRRLATPQPWELIESFEQSPAVHSGVVNAPHLAAESAAQRVCRALLGPRVKKGLNAR